MNIFIIFDLPSTDIEKLKVVDSLPILNQYITIIKTDVPTTAAVTFTTTDQYTLNNDDKTAKSTENTYKSLTITTLIATITDNETYTKIMFQFAPTTTDGADITLEDNAFKCVYVSTPTPNVYYKYNSNNTGTPAFTKDTTNQYTITFEKNTNVGTVPTSPTNDISQLVTNALKILADINPAAVAPVTGATAAKVDTTPAKVDTTPVVTHALNILAGINPAVTSGSTSPTVSATGTTNITTSELDKYGETGPLLVTTT